MYTINSIKGVVNGLDITELDKNFILNCVDNQIKSHKALNKSMDDITLYIVGKYVEGIDVIKVFSSNIVLIETLDTSYTKVRNLATLEEWNTKFLYKIEFENNICSIKITKLKDLKDITLKKPRHLVYAVSNGEYIVKIDVSETDIKGLDYKTLKDIVNYSYNHKLKHKLKKREDNLSYILVEYV